LGVDLVEQEVEHGKLVTHRLIATAATVASAAVMVPPVHVFAAVSPAEGVEDPVMQWGAATRIREAISILEHMYDVSVIEKSEQAPELRGRWAMVQRFVEKIVPRLILGGLIGAGLDENLDEIQTTKPNG
jgi:hypothetical protein